MFKSWAGTRQPQDVGCACEGTEVSQTKLNMYGDREREKYIFSVVTGTWYGTKPLPSWPAARKSMHRGHDKKWFIYRDFQVWSLRYADWFLGVTFWALLLFVLAVVAFLFGWGRSEVGCGSL